jgi:hypothetical protein
MVKRARAVYRARIPASVLLLARALSVGLLLASACLPGAAQAAQSAKLTATLTPEHLGKGTTIGFSFQIETSTGQVPPPLTEVDLRYPNNLGIATSGLGLATCTSATLEALGPGGCPTESLMGSGGAIAEIPIGPEVVHESAPVTIFRAPTEKGQIALLLYVDGGMPVDAQLVLPSLLLSAPAPFGGRVQIGVPLVPSLPDTPDVAVVQLSTTLGPLGITYYERVHGHRIAYRPRGILLPDSCPHGGFPFAAELGFTDGSTARAHAVVPCPAGRGHRRGHASRT